MDYVIAFFILSGSFFCFIAALGVLRFPDLLCRMHASTKAGAFGASLLLIGASIHFWDVRIALQCALVIWFFYITAPIAAHMLSRTSYLMRAMEGWEYELDSQAKNYYLRKGWLPLTREKEDKKDESFEDKMGAE